jgi:hypothetical protein
MLWFSCTDNILDKIGIFLSDIWDLALDARDFELAEVCGEVLGHGYILSKNTETQFILALPIMFELPLIVFVMIESDFEPERFSNYFP